MEVRKKVLFKLLLLGLGVDILQLINSDIFQGIDWIVLLGLSEQQGVFAIAVDEW